MITCKTWLYVVIIMNVMEFVLTLRDEANFCTGKTPRIAIVGAGIGGAATSFFLSELINNNEICVDIYEANKVGGRLSEVEINGIKFDSGGCVIHGTNLYMEYFMKKLNFKRRNEGPDRKFGLYNGKEFTFIESSWTLVNYMKLIWRYGFRMYYMSSYVDKLINTFKTIYEYQENMNTFNDVEELLETLNKDYPEYMTTTLKEALRNEGFSELLIDELVAAGLICNYGQGTNVHQFVGTVSMAGMDSTLWSVDGGHSQVVKGLIKTSGANLIPSVVEEIHLNEDGTFTLLSNNMSNIYNFTVVAAPITDDALFPIIFKEFPNTIHVSGRYHRTVTTILHGKLNHTYFGFDNENDTPHFIPNIGDAFFNSIGEINQVNSEGEQMQDVWKVFTRQPLTPEQLEHLFLEKSDVHIIDWLAYPHYDTSRRKDKFILHKNLFYLNAFEWVASAMEMSSISAKNIALLIFKSLFPERITENQHPDTDKRTEL